MSKTRAFEVGELKAVLDSLIERGRDSLAWACLFALLFGVGARISEILPLRRGDLLNADGTIKDRVRRQKLKVRSGSKEKFISLPLDEGLHKYILPWLEYQWSHYGRGNAADYVCRVREFMRAFCEKKPVTLFTVNHIGR